MKHILYKRCWRLVYGLAALAILTGCEPPKASLHDAVTNESPEKISQIIKENPNVDAADQSGRTPIMRAVEYARPEVVRLLLKAGANPNQRDQRDNTLLMATIDWGKGAAPTKRDIFQPSGYIETLKALIASGANVNATKRGDMTALYLLIVKDSLTIEHYDDQYYGEMAKVLLEGGANMNAGGVNLFLGAVVTGRTGIVRVMLDLQKAEVDARNSDNETALILALKNEQPETAKLLVDRGANIKVVDSSGKTPLALSIGLGNAGLVQSLLEKGADPNIIDNEGKSPLLLAVMKANIDIIKVLLAKGANPNLRTSSGMSPLKSAEWAGRNDIAEILKGAGAKE